MKREKKKQIRKILLICLVVFCLESIVLAFIIQRYGEINLEEKHERADLNATYQNESIQKQLFACEEITEILAYSVINTDGETEFFEDTASELFDKYANIESIQLAPDGVVTMIYPESGNEAGYIDLFADEVRGPIVEYGRDNNVVTVQGPIDLLQGGTGLIFRKPVYLNDGSFWGFAIVIEDTDDLMENTVASMEDFGYTYSFEKTEPVGDGTYGVIGSNGEPEDPEVETFTYGACTWRFSIAPEHGWQPGKSYTELCIGGCVIEILVVVLLFFVLLYRRKQKAFARMASVDYLTGLPNRSALSDWMQSYRAKHPNEPYTEVMLDIDNFKSVNDLHGHDAGDAALKVLANALRSYVGTRGIAARYGGDEFCLILKNMTAAQAAPFVEEFGKNRFTYPVPEGEDTFTISIGYASFPEDATDWGQMYLLADAALYAGKFQGKHACKHFDDSVQKFIRKSQDVQIPEITRKMPLPLFVCEDTGERLVIFASQESLRMLDYPDFGAIEDAAHGKLKNLIDGESFQRLTEGTLKNGDRGYAIRRDGTRVACSVYLGHEKTIEKKTPIIMLFLIPDKPEELEGEKEKPKDENN